MAVVLTVLGAAGAGSVLLSGGADRLSGDIATANAYVVEPVMRFLVSTLEMAAPFEIPGWVKDLYAVLVLIVMAGLVLSVVLGLFLLPIFYALYRSSR